MNAQAWNKNYFKGPVNVERVKVWKKKNPGYWKRPQSQTALQDLFLAQTTVIIGLIFDFIWSPLQDDIATTLFAMQQSGQDILCLQSQTKGKTIDCKKTGIKNTYPKDLQKLQLARSPAGPWPAYWKLKPQPVSFIPVPGLCGRWQRFELLQRSRCYEKAWYGSSLSQQSQIRIDPEQSYWVRRTWQKPIYLSHSRILDPMSRIDMVIWDALISDHY